MRTTWVRTGTAGQGGSVTTGHRSVTVVPCTPVCAPVGVPLVVVELGSGDVVWRGETVVGDGARVMVRGLAAGPLAVAQAEAVTTVSAASTITLVNLAMTFGRPALRGRSGVAGIVTSHSIGSVARLMWGNR